MCFPLREVSHRWRTLQPTSLFPHLRLVPPVGCLSGAATARQHLPTLSWGHAIRPSVSRTAPTDPAHLRLPRCCCAPTGSSCVETFKNHSACRRWLIMERGEFQACIDIKPIFTGVTASSRTIMTLVLGLRRNVEAVPGRRGSRVDLVACSFSRVGLDV